MNSSEHAAQKIAEGPCTEVQTAVEGTATMRPGALQVDDALHANRPCDAATHPVGADSEVGVALRVRPRRACIDPDHRLKVARAV